MDQSQQEIRLNEALKEDDPAAFRTVLDAVKAEGSDDAVLAAAFFLLDRLREENRVSDEIELIKSLLFERRFEDMRTLLQLTDRWIQTSLRIEDFEEMDDAVKYRERFLGAYPKEATMQAFYQAVSLEGKKQYRAALEALDQIPDTLSAAKLASKYLKKAMLQLRLGDIAAADESYRHALVFDPNRQNEIAVLVKADLLAARKDYAAALQTFESFFIKTNQKLRYLDRYVDWTAALERYEDTARFVEAYIPKMLASQSRNYRSQFFEAVLRFAQTIRHEAWIALAAAELRHPKQTDTRDEECRLELEKALRHPVEPFDEHESIRQLFAILAKHHPFERLHWIRVDERQAALWRYRKDRLYEESLASTPFLTDILAHDEAERILFPEDLAGFDDYVSKQSFRALPGIVLFVKRRKDPAGSAVFLIAGVAEEAAKEPLHRAVSLAFAIGAARSAQASALAFQRRRIERQDRWFADRKIAWTTLKNGYLLLENDTARELFPAVSPIVSFEDAFARIETDKPLFPDDFLRPSTRLVRIHRDEPEPALYQLDAFPEADCIRLVFSPAQPLPSKEVSDAASLEERLANEGENAAFGWVRFRDGDPFAAANDETRNTVAALFEAALASAAGSLLFWRRFDADRTGWWAIRTTDKRVIQRIARQTNDILRDRLLQECAIGWDGRLLFAAAFVRPDRPMDAWKEVLDLKAREAQGDDLAVFADRKTWELRERSNAMRVRMEEWMKSDRIPLLYRPYADKANKTYAFCMVVSLDPLDQDEGLLEWTLRRHRMIAEHTQAVWKKAMKEIERFYRETKRHMAFALKIDAAFLTIPASARLMTLEAKRRKIPLSLIRVFVRLEGGTLPQALKTEIAYLEAKGFAIGIVFDGRMTLRTAASIPKGWLLHPEEEGIETLFADPRVTVGRAAGASATIVAIAETGVSLAELISRFPSPSQEGQPDSPAS